MKQRLSFFLRYYFFWFAYFIVARLIFLLYHFRQSFQMSPGEWLLTFLHGSRMDLSTAGYFTAIPGLLLALTVFFHLKNTNRIIAIYTYIMLFISSFIVVADAELYRHWGFRLDATPLFYLSHPKEVTGSFDVTSTIFQVVLFAIFYAGAFWIYQRFMTRKYTDVPAANWKALPVLLFLTAALILPVRGSLGVAPMNTGFVFFHPKNLFANHAAINVVWNAGHAALNMDKQQSVHFFEDEKALKIFEEINRGNNSNTQIINASKPNILLIVLESFSAKIVAPLGGMDSITPNLNAYCNEGVLFNHFFASGDRTDKGIVAVLSGYPAQPRSSIIKFPKKTQSLPFLTHQLDSLNYHTQFIYGGNINFANFNSYINHAAFDDVITKDNFPAKYYNSKWGVHDHVMFERLLEECNNSRQPFAKIALTLSSHEPFDVPMETVIEGSSSEEKFLNSAFYTDKSLGDFIRAARQTTWWDSTLIVLCADHGARHPHNSPYHSAEKFHVPMLWLGGALSVSDTVIKTYGSQHDIPPTLLAQLNVSGNEYRFSKNLLSPESTPFAFYDFNNGFAFITDSVKQIYDLTGKKYLVQEGDINTPTGKAFLQILLDDYQKR